ncbi:hypothetical protein [Arthrobacter globiformis]|nr:hypothetical protein [Arthrobacter globiformis]
MAPVDGIPVLLPGQDSERDVLQARELGGQLFPDPVAPRVVGGDVR